MIPASRLEDRHVTRIAGGRRRLAIFVGMLSQYTLIGDMTPEKYDQHLAEGWFRDTLHLCRGELVILNGELFNVVNIRLDLAKHQFRKSQRALMRKVESRFRVRVNIPQVTAARERLYRLHMSKFTGFVHERLDDALFRSSAERIRLLEFAVYDRNRIVAVSYLDCGDTSVASLMGLYHPDYARFSLGYYTMLKEVQWAMERGYSWYYPGYVFDCPSAFDYKLRIGSFQYMHPGYAWMDGVRRNPDVTTAGWMRRNTEVLGAFLAGRRIPFQRKVYVNYAASDFLQGLTNLLHVPLYLEVRDAERTYAACFDIRRRAFMMHPVEPMEDFEDQMTYRKAGEEGCIESRFMRILPGAIQLPLTPEAGHEPLFTSDRSPQDSGLIPESRSE